MSKVPILVQFNGSLEQQRPLFRTTEFKNWAKVIQSYESDEGRRSQFNCRKTKIIITKSRFGQATPWHWVASASPVGYQSKHSHFN